MGRAKAPRRVYRYSAEFKLKAVKLSQIEGVKVQDVANALDTHLFMLSRWRKEAREGKLRARVAVAPEARQHMTHSCGGNQVNETASDTGGRGASGGVAMLEYRGHTGFAEVDGSARTFHGEVLDTRDVITFQGTTVGVHCRRRCAPRVVWSSGGERAA